MIKALFFDVDGTLVSFKTHKIPERTIQALQMAHDQGVKIFTATGRPRQLLNNIPEVEHLMDGYILATGALCIYGETVVREDLISHEEVLALVDHYMSHSKFFYLLNISELSILKNVTANDLETSYILFLSQLCNIQRTL